MSTPLARVGTPLLSCRLLLRRTLQHGDGLPSAWTPETETRGGTSRDSPAPLPAPYARVLECFGQKELLRKFIHSERITSTVTKPFLL